VTGERRAASGWVQSDLEPKVHKYGSNAFEESTSSHEGMQAGNYFGTNASKP
jgi:hypothetical protein